MGRNEESCPVFLPFSSCEDAFLILNKLFTGRARRTIEKLHKKRYDNKIRESVLENLCVPHGGGL